MDIISWLPFAGSIIVVVLGALFGRRKQSADIVSQMSATALSFVIPLREDIARLEREREVDRKELEKLRPLPLIVKNLESQLAEMRRGIDILITQVRRRGDTPDWIPEWQTQPVEPKRRAGW